jgi:hypothetical protein
MANEDRPHTNGSQFWFCPAEHCTLHTKFVAFGKLESGFDVLDKIDQVLFVTPSVLNPPHPSLNPSPRTLNPPNPVLNTPHRVLYSPHLKVTERTCIGSLGQRRRFSYASSIQTKLINKHGLSVAANAHQELKFTFFLIGNLCQMLVQRASALAEIACQSFYKNKKSANNPAWR